MSFGVTQTGEGRPLVLLHGVGVDHRGFDLRSVALRTADGLRREGIEELSVAYEIQRIRPGTPLEVIGGSGHVPHVEAPGEFAAALDRLLARLADPG